MMLKDLGGNASKTRGAINVELTIGCKTLLTTFFVIDGKGSYSLLLGRDWIHAPSEQWEGGFIRINNEGQQPIRAVGS